MAVELEREDKLILNHVQRGFPVTSRPFREVGERVGLPEGEVLRRLRRLLDEGAITRVGPVINTRRLGGDSLLAAMHVPQERLEEVAEITSSYRQVTHNYERDHYYYNLWFVLSSDSPQDIQDTVADIEERCGIEVVPFPNEEQFFIGVRFEFEVD